jgi:hypothetical protein
MVVAVQCPNPKCRKYMLVEERDRDKEVVCLLCKNPFRIEAEPSPLAGKMNNENKISNE